MTSTEKAKIYQTFQRSQVYELIRESIRKEADTVRRNATKDYDTAYGELRYADGIEWLEQHVKQRGALDKIK